MVNPDMLPECAICDALQSRYESATFEVARRHNALDIAIGTQDMAAAQRLALESYDADERLANARSAVAEHRAQTHRSAVIHVNLDVRIRSVGINSSPLTRTTLAGKLRKIYAVRILFDGLRSEAARRSERFVPPPTRRSIKADDRDVGRFDQRPTAPDSRWHRSIDPVRLGNRRLLW